MSEQTLHFSFQVQDGQTITAEISTDYDKYGYILNVMCDAITMIKIHVDEVDLKLR